MMYEIYHNYNNAYQQLLLISVVSRGDSRLLENYVLSSRFHFACMAALNQNLFFLSIFSTGKKNRFAVEICSARECRRMDKEFENNFYNMNFASRCNK